MKMLYFILFIAYIGPISLSSNINNILKEIKFDPFDESQAELGNIKNTIAEIENSIFINPKLNGCNIKFNEKTKFAFENPTNTIYYTIISKKLPLYNFIPSISDDDNNHASISSFNLYKDKSYRQRQIITADQQLDATANNIKFRDRWVIEVILSRPVTRISINFSYYGERAILINT